MRQLDIFRENFYNFDMRKIFAFLIFTILLFSGCTSSKQRFQNNLNDYRYISILKDDINFGEVKDAPSIQSIIDSAIEHTYFEVVEDENKLSDEQKKQFLVASLNYDFNPVVRKVFVRFTLTDYTSGQTVAEYKHIFKKMSYSSINSCVMNVMNSFARENLRQ